jgi:hypothetical protein
LQQLGLGWRLKQASQSPYPLFAGRLGPDSQGMNPLAGNVAQRGVDHALALETRDAIESRAFDFDGEVRFATAIMPGVAVVAGAVVDNLKACRRKGLFEYQSDFLSDFGGDIGSDFWVVGSVHGFSSSASRCI